MCFSYIQPLVEQPCVTAHVFVVCVYSNIKRVNQEYCET